MDAWRDVDASGERARAAGVGFDDAGRVVRSLLGAGGDGGGGAERTRVASRRPVAGDGAYDCEVLSVEPASGDGPPLLVFAKHGPSPVGGHPGPGSGAERSGPAREAAVYDYVLGPLGLPAPRLVGFAHDAQTDADWLLLEHLDGAVRLDEVGGGRLAGRRRERATHEAAAVLGLIHGAAEGAWPDLLASGLPFLDAFFYETVVARADTCAGPLHDEYPWLAGLCRRAADLHRPLLGAAHTVVHGEFTARNVLVCGRGVVVVDWESALLGPGELDLARLTLGLHQRAARRLEAAYAGARWPGGPPASFAPALRAARLHLCFRLLGRPAPGLPAPQARRVMYTMAALVS